MRRLGSGGQRKSSSSSWKKTQTGRLHLLPFLQQAVCKLHNIGYLILHARRTWGPAQVLPRPLRLSARIQSPTQSVVPGSLLGSVDLDRPRLGSWDVALGNGGVGNPFAHFSPCIVGALGQEVAVLGAPKVWAPVPCGSSLSKEREEVGQVMNVDKIPACKAASNNGSLLICERDTGESFDLARALVDGAATGSCSRQRVALGMWIRTVSSP